MKHKDWCKNYATNRYTGLCACISPGDITGWQPDVSRCFGFHNGVEICIGDRVLVKYMTTDLQISGLVNGISAYGFTIGSSERTINVEACGPYFVPPFTVTVIQKAQHRIPAEPSDGTIVRDKHGFTWQLRKLLWERTDNPDFHRAQWRELWNSCGPLERPNSWGIVK